MCIYYLCIYMHTILHILYAFIYKSNIYAKLILIKMHINV